MSSRTSAMRDRLRGEITESITQDTYPGKSNEEFMQDYGELSDVVSLFVQNTNDWFEIVDVRMYRNGVIGIPCRYRWTIHRWVANDMDRWLREQGWTLDPHRRADSYTHEDNEMEARYRREFEGYEVAANMYVEFTEDVFRKLNQGKLNKTAERVKNDLEAIEDIKNKKRS